MPLTSPYSDEALEHLAQPDPLDDLIRASPPREGFGRPGRRPPPLWFSCLGILLGADRLLDGHSH